MEAKDFCYWLQGYLELSGTKSMNEQELQILRDHLKTVFVKVTPQYQSVSQGYQQGISGQLGLIQTGGAIC